MPSGRKRRSVMPSSSSGADPSVSGSSSSLNWTEGRPLPSLSSPSSSVAASAGSLASMASRSRISRNCMRPSLSAFDHSIIAVNVIGLSHRPAIIVLRPASMRLAMAISPSRLSSSTAPISRRYMRTGSSVRSSGALTTGADGAVPRSPSTASGSSSSSSARAVSAGSSAGSSFSMMLMPISDSADMMSSICSDDI